MQKEEAGFLPELNLHGSVNHGESSELAVAERVPGIRHLGPEGATPLWTQMNPSVLTPSGGGGRGNRQSAQIVQIVLPCSQKTNYRK